MGSGKSYQARSLAVRFGAEIIRTDILRKESFDIKPTDHLYENFGHGIYSDDISLLIYDKAFDLAAQKIKQGKSVIIDASFKRMTERREALDLALNIGVRFYILECVCPDEITKKRLEKRVRENDHASDGRWELFQKQKNAFDAINEIPKDCLFRIETSSNPEICRQEIIRKIKFDE
jgi:predicted kinase